MANDKRYRITNGSGNVSTVMGASFVHDGMGKRILNDEGGTVFSTSDHSYTIIEETAITENTPEPTPVDPPVEDEPEDEPEPETPGDPTE